MTNEPDVLERQTKALEAIATELRYQNAVFCELVVAIDDLCRRVDDHHYPEQEPRDRTGRALQRDIQDRLFDRDRDEERLSEWQWGAPENWKQSDSQ